MTTTTTDLEPPAFLKHNKGADMTTAEPKNVEKILDAKQETEEQSLPLPTLEEAIAIVRDIDNRIDENTRGIHALETENVALETRRKSARKLVQKLARAV
jgi:hypothetical protein